jgi:putative flavoprotein involved in K+ transport
MSPAARAGILRSTRTDAEEPMSREYVQTIVVGGGQAGLATGHALAELGLPFAILDASARVGDAWRHRWDSLRLFTPARWSGLPGMRFPGPGGASPTKDQLADYLEAYAQRFALPVRSGVRVERLGREGGRFVLAAEGGCWEADQVIVAMANFQVPRLPAFAGALDPDVRQLHAHAYRNPSTLRDGPVLVVGVGNSGAEIAAEVARTHPTWLAGKETGHVPFRIDGFLGRHLGTRIVRFLGHHLLSLRTPVGRRVRPKLLRVAGPLVRVRPVDLARAGVERVPRVVDVREGRPVLADGRVLAPANVIWCTGYRPGFSWIDLPAFGDDGGDGGEPLHARGVVAGVPGLYFVGLHFLFSMSSATLIGIGRDAKHVARAVRARVRAGAEERPAPAAAAAASAA